MRASVATIPLSSAEGGDASDGVGPQDADDRPNAGELSEIKKTTRPRAVEFRTEALGVR